MIFKVNEDWIQLDSACTLQVSDLGTHNSGWTIEGEIVSDYFEWVNQFVATHPVYGRIEGDYEHQIYAPSKPAWEHFHQNHPPFHWDYRDI